MNKITLTVAHKDIEITANRVRVAYTDFTHEEFNLIIEAYKLLGFYKNTSLALAEEVAPAVDAAVSAAPSDDDLPI